MKAEETIINGEKGWILFYISNGKKVEVKEKDLFNIRNLDTGFFPDINND